MLIIQVFAILCEVGFLMGLSSALYPKKRGTNECFKTEKNKIRFGF